MLMTFLQILLGIGGFAGGIAAGLSGLKQYEHDQIPWLIAVSFILFGAGGYFFYLASRYSERKQILDEEHIVHTHPGNVLLKNNALLSEFIKSAEKKDKMKTLKIVAAAEEQFQDQKKIGS